MDNCLCGGLFVEIENGLLSCLKCWIVIDPNIPVLTEAEKEVKRLKFEKANPGFGYDYGKPWEELGKG